MLSFSPTVSPISSAPQLWEATLGQLLLRVTRQNYETWLRNTIGLRFEGTTLVVAAANELSCDWLSTRMSSVVSQALHAVAGNGLQVRYEAPCETLPCSDSSMQPPLLPQPAPQLNPRFTFSTFLEADFNQLALLAARDVADQPASLYSPLFITGEGGSGKTHLLHAIGHEAAQRGVRFLLVGAEQFLSEFTTSVRNKTGAAFRARYRDLELLLVDDAHQLLGKKATSAEFYQTLAGLHDQGRRVAIAGDIAAMSGEATRFQNALRWGLVASIDTASIEDRVRFVRAKAESTGMELPDEVQHYLALRIKSSIRDLEGAVNRVTAVARISREPLTIDFAARALQPVASMPVPLQPKLPPSQLIAAVCRHLDVTPADLTSSRRERALTYARHITMYLLRQDAGLTYAAIAALLGKKDHSTVVHACTQVHKERAVSPQLHSDLDAIRASLDTSTSAA